MPSEFRAICETARQQIAVPENSADDDTSCSRRARFPTQTWKAHHHGVLLGLVILGAAAAAAVWRGTPYPLAPPGRSAYRPSKRFTSRKPQRRAIFAPLPDKQSSRFRFPSGLPSGTSYRGDRLRGPRSPARGLQSLPEGGDDRITFCVSRWSIGVRSRRPTVRACSCSASGDLRRQAPRIGRSVTR